jgi:autotransporter-associated beta strand protein
MSTLVLNDVTANNNLTFANAIDLDGASRTINANANGATITGIMSDSTASGAGLTKGGAGTLNLNAANTYTGVTEVSAGTLGGTGSLAGPLLVDSGATLSPGTTTGLTIGTFTVNKSVTLNGSVQMEINRTNAQNASLLAASSVAFGGTLIVANTGPTLALGDTFHLFNGTINGTFAATNLPTLAANLAWDTSGLGTSGTLKVAAASLSSPAILPVYLDHTGTNLVIRASTVQGHNYLLESTTNLIPPIVWLTYNTTAGTGGTITNGVPVKHTVRNQFFRYSVQ